MASQQQKEIPASYSLIEGEGRVAMASQQKKEIPAISVLVLSIVALVLSIAALALANQNQKCPCQNATAGNATAGNAAGIIDEVDDIFLDLNIISQYRASLTWKSTADLDIYVKIIATGEVIEYDYQRSQDGKVDLDVDHREGTYPTGEEKRWVENVSFRKDGTYEIYVNNHRSNSDTGEVPYSVIIKNGPMAETQLIRGSWNIDEMGQNPDGDLAKMMKTATIEVEGSEM